MTQLQHIPELKDSSPVKIVIADDHPLFRKGLREVIESNPRFEVVREAADGEEAWRAIRELNPDVTILDLDMPVRNGLETARVIQTHGWPVAVIFLTMYKEEDMFNEAMDAGARGYVLKENAASDILQCIETVAAGHHYVSATLSDLLLSRHTRAETLRQERPGLSRLTPSEKRILKSISENKTSKEIAEALGLSPRTIENHRANICAKLGLHGIHSLVKFAFDNRSRL